MRPQYSIVSDAGTEPVTYAEAAAHVRVDSTDDQSYVEGLVAVARDYVDQLTGRQSAAVTWKVIASAWDDIFETVDGDSVSIIDPRRGLLPWTGSDWVIPLRRTPLATVSHVKYYAPDAESLTTLSTDDYRVITAAEPGLVQLTSSPPAVDDRADAIEIQFITGATPSDLQKHAIKLMVGHLYENRLPVDMKSIEKVEHSFDAILNLLKKGGWF